MEYLNIGYIASTHGIKGELKIKSSFEYKDKIFVINKPLYIGEDCNKVIIKGYRAHKDYDMVVLDGYSDINMVQEFLRESVYIKKDELELSKNEYIETDLIGMEVMDDNKLVGIITSFRYLTKNKKIIVIDDCKYLPFEKEFIKDIDLNNKKVYINSIKGMF